MNSYTPNEFFIESGAVDWTWKPKLPFSSATVFVSSVLMVFDEPPTQAGEVVLSYSNNKNAVFDGTLKEAPARGKDSVLLEFQSILPLHLDRFLRLQYPNPDNRSVAITVFFTYMN